MIKKILESTSSERKVIYNSLHEEMNKLAGDIKADFSIYTKFYKHDDHSGENYFSSKSSKKSSIKSIKLESSRDYSKDFPAIPTDEITKEVEASNDNGKSFMKFFKKKPKPVTDEILTGIKITESLRVLFKVAE